MVSIILVNYNTCKMTDECINSIIQHTSVEYEIILVDNASTDESRDFFREDTRIAKAIWLKENIGFGRANNEGIKIANGDYLFLLNTDTILLNDAIFCLIEASKVLNTDKYVLGGWLVDNDGNPTASSGEFSSCRDELIRAITVYSSRLFRKKKNFTNEHSAYLTPVEVVLGADMFMSRKVVDDSGMFDPAFFMYYEEMDWQFRMSKLNIPRYLVSTPKIIHLCGGSQGVQPNKKKMGRILRITKSMFIYLRKYNNGFKVTMFKYLYLLLRLLPVLFVPEYTNDEKKQYIKLLISE